MALLRYKPEQGYYTRTLSFIWFLTLAAAFALWLWQQLSVVETNTLYYQAGVVVGLAVIVIPLLYWLINKPGTADFMIATELEMKKVNWPSRREIIGSTIVVIAGTFLFAGILFVIDLGFGGLFRGIGILRSNES